MFVLIMKKIMFILLSILTWCSNISGQNQSNKYEIVHSEFIPTKIQTNELWSLDDHWIADFVWFSEIYGDYFDWVVWSLESMFSCKDVYENELKRKIADNCVWYRTEYSNTNFIHFWSLDFNLENGKVIAYPYEIIKYEISNSSFEFVINNYNERLDKNLCIKEHDVWRNFENSWIMWVAWLWKNLNSLLNNDELVLYDIHESFNENCSNKQLWMLIYKKWTNIIYTILSDSEQSPFPMYDWIYATPFSVDILFD